MRLNAHADGRWEWGRVCPSPACDSTTTLVDPCQRMAAQRASMRLSTRARSGGHHGRRQAHPRGLPPGHPLPVVEGAAAAIDFYTGCSAPRSACGCRRPRQVGHAELEIGDSVIMLADEFPEMGSKAPKSVGGHGVDYVYVEDVDATFEKALEAGAKESAVENQFYGDRSGSFEDPFGHRTSPPTSRTSRPRRWRSAWRSRRAAEPAGSRRPAPSLRWTEPEPGPPTHPGTNVAEIARDLRVASPPAAADGGRRCRAGRRDGLTSTPPPPPGARCVPSRQSPACDRSWVVARPHASRSPIGDRLPALNDAPVGGGGGL